MQVIAAASEVQLPSLEPLAADLDALQDFGLDAVPYRAVLAAALATVRRGFDWTSTRGNAESSCGAR